MENYSIRKIEIKDNQFVAELIRAVFDELNIPKVGTAYEDVYLDFMLDAQKLYKKVGFEYICSPVGSTGHVSCPIWMLKDLTS